MINRFQTSGVPDISGVPDQRRTGSAAYRISGVPEARKGRGTPRQKPARAEERRDKSPHFFT